MTSASKYNDEWQGYHGKADRLLNHVFPSGDFYFGWNQYRPLERDGEWFKIGKAYNVGPKFLRWMVDHELLERRKRGLSPGALINDWYRLKQPNDFGDLWVPD